MRTLVTGATGFLGRAVTERLAREGGHVRVLHRRGSDVEPIRRYVAETVVGEITDPLAAIPAATGMDAIIHVAGDLSHWRARRERVMRTNVTGTRIVAEAAKTAGVPLLIHVSSVAAVGYSPDGSPIDETAPNNFVPLRLVYHESKRLGEEEALDVRRYGVRVVIVNPGTLYGPRSLAHPFGHTMLELARGAVPGHPSGGLSVVDVDDVAAAIAAALARGGDGERYLLAGENLTYAELFARQAAQVGIRYRGRTLPSAALHAAARAFELRARFDGREPRLTLDNARLAPLRMWYASAKAERELGFRARPAEETFERMVRAYRESGALVPRGA